MKLEEKVKYICNCEYKYFLNKKNVVGVALGYKTVRGFNTLIKCIKVLVSKKVSMDKLNKEDIIPKEYKGIDTDVIKTGIIEGFSFTERVRPALGGYSVGPASRDLRGTFTCLVGERKKYYVLGCSHVLAGENTVSIGTAILQPSIDDKGREPRDNIAYLSRYIPIRYITKSVEPVNFVDCAIAEVKNTSLVSNRIVAVGNIKGVIDPVLNLDIKKVGCITELTFGRIVLINATIRMRIPRGICLMQDQIGLTPLSDYGDSGSLVLDPHENAVGLLCGGTSTASFCTPIKNVLDALGVKIITG